MRHTSALLSIALFEVSLPIAAQAADPPNGSYRKTCTVKSYNNLVLEAACRNENDSNLVTTQIDTRSCGAEVFNRDGGLQCFAPVGHWGQGRAVPPGSYLETCKNIIVSGNKISAECKDSYGTYRNTEMSITNPVRGQATPNCRPGQGIDNRNGNLVCHR